MRDLERRISELEEAAEASSGRFKCARIIARDGDDVSGQAAQLEADGATLVIVRRLVAPIVMTDGSVNPNAARP